MTNVGNVVKIRNIALPRKVHAVKTMTFPVVMYSCESWTIKKDGHWRIDGFELWCWRRLLRVPWIARGSNESALKEINLEYSSEGLMLKLKLQYFWPPDMKSWLTGKDLDAAKVWRQEEKVEGYHGLDGLQFEQTSGDSKGQGSLVCYSSQGCKEPAMT